MKKLYEDSVMMYLVDIIRDYVRGGGAVPEMEAFIGYLARVRKVELGPGQARDLAEGNEYRAMRLEDSV